MSSTVEAIWKVLGWVITPALSFWIGSLLTERRKIKDNIKQKEEQNNLEFLALKETCKYMLKKSLKEDYDFYALEQGWCPVNEKEDIEKAYEIYSNGLHGNGPGTRYYKVIMALPEQPPCINQKEK